MGKVNRQLNILFCNSLTKPSPLQSFPAWSTDQQFYPLFFQSFAILTQPMGVSCCTALGFSSSCLSPSEANLSSLPGRCRVSRQDRVSFGSALFMFPKAALPMHCPEPCPHLTFLLSSHFQLPFHYFQHHLLCPSKRTYFL